MLARAFDTMAGGGIVPDPRPSGPRRRRTPGPGIRTLAANRFAVGGRGEKNVNERSAVTYSWSVFFDKWIR